MVVNLSRGGSVTVRIFIILSSILHPKFNKRKVDDLQVINGKINKSNTCILCQFVCVTLVLKFFDNSLYTIILLLKHFMQL